MKPGSYLVNTARGPIIDEAALAEALDAGRLAGAALDVMTQEPPPPSPLFGRDNVIITPHTSFYSEESLVELQVKAAQEVVAVLSGNAPRHPVNPEVFARSMRAMVLTAPGTLVRDEVARPGATSGDVLVRVTHSGICGTDFKIFNGAIPVRYPRIMGHEMAGEVVDAGSSTLRSGDRIIVDPQLYCRTCFHCRIGQTHLCTNGMLVGRDTDGGFAEYVSAPASHVFPLPQSVDTRTAPLIQVLTTCLHAQRQIDIFPGELVVVLGLGVTGQLHVQLAKARGATVIGVTRSTGQARAGGDARC